MGFGLGAWLAKSALMMSPAGAYIRAAGGVMKKIPWQVWAAIGAAIALWLGVRWHHHEVHKVYQSGYNQAVVDIRAQEAKKVAPLKEAKAVGDAALAASNEGVKKAHDAQNAHIDRNLADLLGVYTNTQGRLRDHTGNGVPGANAASGAGRTAAPADDRLAQVPAGYPGGDLLIAVPAKGLATRLAVCDRDYTALTAWEDQYAAYIQTYNAWLAKTRKIAQ